MSEVVTVSKKFEIQLPRAICKSLDVKPGDELVLLEKGRQVVLVPVRPIQELRGAFPGLTTTDLRDETNRFD